MSVIRHSTAPHQGRGRAQPLRQTHIDKVKALLTLPTTSSASGPSLPESGIRFRDLELCITSKSLSSPSFHQIQREPAVSISGLELV